MTEAVSTAGCIEFALVWVNSARECRFIAPHPRAPFRSAGANSIVESPLRRRAESRGALHVARPEVDSEFQFGTECVGRPVVISPGVGNVDAKATRANAGIAVELFDGGTDSVAAEAVRVHDMQRNDGNAMRERALKLCEQHFLWSNYIDEDRSAYVQSLSA